MARVRRRGGVRGDGPGNGPPDLPRDERLTPRRPAAATVVVTVLSQCVDGGNGGGGDSYAAPSSANRAEAAREPMPAIVASAHRCPQCSRRARVQLHACQSVTRDHDLRARETIRVMRAADAEENCMQRFSPPVLITTSMFSIIARGSEYSAAQRLSPWRKGTRRRERRATSPESARARARAAAASAQPQSEARVQRAHKATQRRVAPSTRRALYETTTSVTEAFCSRSAPIKRASAFCCILPLGVSRVACFHEHQPALFFFGCRSANRPSEGSTKLSNGR